MNYLMCETGNTGSIVWGIVLFVMIIGYFILMTVSKRKNQEQTAKLLNELKKGDKVVTNAGIYGEVVSIKETNMGKVVVIKTGDEDDKDKASYLTINSTVILGIDNKKDLILDENGNVIDDEEKQELKEDILPKEEEKEEKEDKEDKKEEKSKKKAKKAVATDERF